MKPIKIRMKRGGNSDKGKFIGGEKDGLNEERTLKGGGNN